MKIIRIEPCYEKHDTEMFSGEAELENISITKKGVEDLKNHFQGVQVTQDYDMLILTNPPNEKIMIFDTGRTIIRRVMSKEIAIKKFELIEKILSN